MARAGAWAGITRSTSLLALAHADELRRARAAVDGETLSIYDLAREVRCLSEQNPQGDFATQAAAIDRALLSTGALVELLPVAPPQLNWPAHGFLNPSSVHAVALLGSPAMTEWVIGAAHPTPTDGGLYAASVNLGERELIVLSTSGATRHTVQLALAVADVVVVDAQVADIGLALAELSLLGVGERPEVRVVTTAPHLADELHAKWAGAVAAVSGPGLDHVFASPPRAISSDRDTARAAILMELKARGPGAVPVMERVERVWSKVLSCNRGFCAAPSLAALNARAQFLKDGAEDAEEAASKAVVNRMLAAAYSGRRPKDWTIESVLAECEAALLHEAGRRGLPTDDDFAVSSAVASVRAFVRARTTQVLEPDSSRAAVLAYLSSDHFLLAITRAQLQSAAVEIDHLKVAAAVEAGASPAELGRALNKGGTADDHVFIGELLRSYMAEQVPSAGTAALQQYIENGRATLLSLSRVTEKYTSAKNGAALHLAMPALVAAATVLAASGGAHGRVPLSTLGRG